jgi:isoleucyl-tRNA synthetase
MSDAPDKTDYRSTVFLPKTDFPMKAGLPQKEPLIQAKWQESDIYSQVRKSRAGREKFILHDGPPYANGDMHIGHALNHILKDMVVRTQTLLGKDAPYVPGWDCHGLPIEWKVEEQYRKKKLWSPVEKTALAEAEIEYEDITSTQIDVAFEIVESPLTWLVGAHAVVWTTTPWTIPVNQAIAYNPDIEYSLFSVYDGDKEIKVLVASQLLTEFLKRTGLQVASVPLERGVYRGKDLTGTIARHPMHHLGGFFAKPRPFLPGDFVTTDSGTGLVHMAPDHGEDDFELCRAHGIEPQFAVEADGRYRDDWPWLGGNDERRMSVINPKFNAPDGPINNDLREAGALLAASADYQHSYPHSWRSKAKVIYRCTPQWFVAMDKPLGHRHAKTRAEKRWENEGGALINGAHLSDDENATLRQLAMAAIAETRFVPEKGRNRIGSMVEGRPDWVLSRQRAWGVPIAVFVEKKTGKLLVDHDVNERIVAAIKAEGVDAWEEERAQEYLGNSYNAADYEMQADILDVWFDSGCTHVFTLESGHWPEQRWPADLYLEGSDQHRGWFQSSLLQSCGTRGRAPYDQVLTHGFTMDPKGMKMSKSLGNTIDPIKVMETNGADIIRLWALSVDFTEDHRIGDEILKGVGDQYRKLRNSFRYMLGALDGFEESERLPVGEMPELERYMLALTAELDARLRRAVNDYDFNDYTRALTDFCNEDLSAFFFDIRKDSLYCDAPGDPKRRAYRTVLDTLFHALVRWAAPVLVFTAEEVWGTRYPDGGSVHLLEWPLIDSQWRGDAALVAKWAELRQLREAVTEAIEPLRRDKVIGSSLEAEITVPSDADPALLAELFIVSSVKRGNALAVTKTDFHKCGRCWRLLPEVKADGDLCDRCTEVVGG